MTAPRAGSDTTGIPQPPPAERARTVAARASAALQAVGVGAVELSLAGTTAAGQVLVVVPADGRVVTALRASPEGDLPARLLAFLLAGHPPGARTPDAEPPAVPDRLWRAGG